MSRPERLLAVPLAILAGALLAGCVEGLDQAAAGCGSGAGCGPREVCVEAESRCCTPLECGDLPCDTTDDGCGRALECPCPQGNVCVDGSCSCVPRSSCIKDQHYTCGELDNCGAILSCPCDPGFKCEEDGSPCVFTCEGRCGQHVDDQGIGNSCNVCDLALEWCTTEQQPPVPPEVHGYFPPGFCYPCDCSEGACGPRPPGQCDGAPACECTLPESCGGAGVPNRCGCLTGTQAELCFGRECGELVNCGEPVSCGSCPSPTACSPLGRCLDEVQPFCWDTPVPWVELEPLQGNEQINALVPVQEPDGLWLYVNFGNGDGSRIGRVPLAPDGIAQRGPFEPLDQLAIPDHRYAGIPTVRDDGLELLFSTDLLSAWGASRTYVSTRASTVEPWGAPSELQLPLPNYYGSLLILDDHVTLLVSGAGGYTGQAVVLRRQDTEPGSGPFGFVSTLQLDELSGGIQHEVSDLTFGCHRDAIHYAWVAGELLDAGVVELLSLAPVTIGPPGIVDILPFPGSPARPGNFITLAESPGCDLFYVRLWNGLYRSARRPCP